MGSTGAAQAISAVEDILGAITGRRNERINLLRRREAGGSLKISTRLPFNLPSDPACLYQPLP
jgi:hypothetical protein